MYKRLYVDSEGLQGTAKSRRDLSGVVGVSEVQYPRDL